MVENGKPRRGHDTCCRLCGKRPWCEKNATKGRQSCNVERQSQECIRLIQCRWCSICNQFSGADAKKDPRQLPLFLDAAPIASPPVEPTAAPAAAEAQAESPTQPAEKLCRSVPYGSPQNALCHLIPADCSDPQTRRRLLAELPVKAKELGLEFKVVKNPSDGLLDLYAFDPKTEPELVRNGRNPIYLSSIEDVDDPKAKPPAEKPKKQGKKKGAKK